MSWDANDTAMSKAMHAEMREINGHNVKTRRVGEFELAARSRAARLRFWTGYVDSYDFNDETQEGDERAYAGMQAQHDNGLELIALKYGRTTDA